MIEFLPDPHAMTVLAQRYGAFQGTEFIPAPGHPDPARARERVETHGRTWHVVQVKATVVHAGTVGSATVPGVEDDRPVHVCIAELQALKNAEVDAEDWAILDL